MFTQVFYVIILLFLYNINRVHLIHIKNTGIAINNKTNTIIAPTSVALNITDSSSRNEEGMVASSSVGFKLKELSSSNDVRTSLNGKISNNKLIERSGKNKEGKVIKDGMKNDEISADGNKARQSSETEKSEVHLKGKTILQEQINKTGTYLVLSDLKSDNTSIEENNTSKEKEANTMETDEKLVEREEPDQIPENINSTSGKTSNQLNNTEISRSNIKSVNNSEIGRKKSEALKSQDKQMKNSEIEFNKHNNETDDQFEHSYSVLDYDEKFKNISEKYTIDNSSDPKKTKGRKLNGSNALASEKQKTLIKVSDNRKSDEKKSGDLAGHKSSLDE